MPVLIEINIGREESKGGLMEEELPAFLNRVVDCPNLEVRGLMCIAPLVADPETARPYFARMRELAEKIRKPARFQNSNGAPIHGNVSRF